MRAFSRTTIARFYELGECRQLRHVLEVGVCA
jgi:hypothetical protein